MGYVNPFTHATGLVHGRQDDGVDFSMNVGSPIVAIGNGRCVRIAYGWYNGQPIMVFTLDDGPRAGWKWYIAEQISPSVSEGQHVNAGQQICTYASSGTAIEIGWASPTQDNFSSWPTLAQHNGHGGMTPSPEAQDFDNFLGSLGGGGPITTGPGPTIGATIDLSPLQDAIAGTSLARYFLPGTNSARNRAYLGWQASTQAWGEYQPLHQFTTQGGA